MTALVCRTSVESLTGMELPWLERQQFEAETAVPVWKCCLCAWLWGGRSRFTGLWIKAAAGDHRASIGGSAWPV